METTTRHTTVTANFRISETEPSISNLLEALRKSGLTNDQIIDHLEHEQKLSQDDFDFQLPEYEEIIKREDYFRNDLYDPQYQDDQINHDKYYGLIKFTEEMYEELESIELDNDFLFGRYTLDKRHSNLYDCILDLDRKVEFHNNMIIAGGTVFSTLFETSAKGQDIDYFFVDTDKEVATSIIYRYAKQSDQSSRSENTITCMKNGKEHQFILRLYKSISEVLHGFDVDCCSMGFDGKYIWITERCWYALRNGFNVFNRTRASPSYLYRLMKYAKRGLPIYLAGFDRSLVNEEILQETVNKEIKKLDSRSRIKHLCSEHMNNVKGITSIHNFVYKYAQNVIHPEILFSPSYCSIDKMLVTLFRERENIRSLKESGFFEELRQIVRGSDHNKYGLVHEGLAKLLILERLDEILTHDIYNAYVKENIEESDYQPKGFRKNYHLEQVSDNYRGLYLDTPPIRNVNFLIVEQRHGFRQLIDMDDELYDILSKYHGYNFSQKVEFKTTNPGEQATSTYNVQIIEDLSIFFESEYYNYTE